MGDWDLHLPGRRNKLLCSATDCRGYAAHASVALAPWLWLLAAWPAQKSRIPSHRQLSDGTRLLQQGQSYRLTGSASNPVAWLIP